MNKVILLGRVVKDPEVRYSQGANPTAIARYSLAVPKRFKKDGEPDADFINCVAFGKTGEFAEKFLKKGTQIAVVGRLQVRSFDSNDGKKQWATEVVVEEHYFAGSNNSGNTKPNLSTPEAVNDDADELPFE